MKTPVLFALAIALFCVGAYAQTTATPDVPAMPGCTLVTDVNLSENDILGMVKQAIQGFAEASAGATGDVALVVKEADPVALSQIIEGVKALRFAQFTLPAGVGRDKVLAFYDRQFPPADGWTRVLYDVTLIPKGGVEIYTKAGQEFFGTGVDPKSNRVFAFRTVGTVDVAKLGSWLGGMAKLGASMKAENPAPKTAAKKPVKSTKKVAKKK
jgi:hypothetical protein